MQRINPYPTFFFAAVSHLRIDWISNNWYLVDEQRGVLYACSAALDSCRILIDSGLSKVHGLVLDPIHGLVRINNLLFPNK